MAVISKPFSVPAFMPAHSGLRYQKDEGVWSVYVMELDGRPIFEVSVDNADPDLIIYVGRVGARWAQVHEVADADFGVSLETNGRAAKGMHEVGGSPETPGDIVDHIDGMSVQSYVYPRVARIMADIFIPKNG